MKCFLLSVICSEEPAGSAAEYALVAIDQDVAKKILQRKETFQMAKSKDPDLRQLSFIDRYCYFYTAGVSDALEEYMGGEDVMEAFVSEGIHEVDEELSLDDELQARTANDMMVITQEGFSWVAIDHYGSEHYETRELSFDVLLSLM